MPAIGTAVATQAIDATEVPEPSQVSPQEPAATRAENLEAAMSTYVDAMQGGLYTEAADATKLYIMELLNDPEHDRREWGLALSRLGDAQLRADEYGPSIENFSLAIETFEQDGDYLSADLIEPLTSLGTAYFEARDFPSAATTFQRAIHVRQVNEGLNTLESGQVWDALAETYYYLGNYDAALAAEQAYVSLYTQNFGENDLRRLPALYSRAQMLRRIDREYESQKAYFRIISLIEKADGSGSLHLLPAIYETADLMQRDRFDPVVDDIRGTERARRYLRRAIYIAEHHPEATALDVADAYIRMGDYLARSTPDRSGAIRQYSKAWRLLSDDDAHIGAREERFGAPVLLNEVPYTIVPIMRELLASAMYAEDELDARVIIGYDVDESGEPRNVEMVEADPTGFLDPIVIRHVGKFVFRPLFIDGEPVRSPRQTYEIRYSGQHAARLQDY